MARTPSKQATTKVSAPKTAGRIGRPTNASREAARQSEHRNLMEIVGIAASNAARGAVEAALAGGVTTIGVAQPSTTSNSATSTTSKRGGSPNGSTPRKSPGRKPDPTSKLSKSRIIYAENFGKLERNAIVDLMVKELGLDKPVANTYYHSIHRAAGGKPNRRTAVKKAA